MLCLSRSQGWMLYPSCPFPEEVTVPVDHSTPPPTPLSTLPSPLLTHISGFPTQTPEKQTAVSLFWKNLNRKPKRTRQPRLTVFFLPVATPFLCCICRKPCKAFLPFPFFLVFSLSSQVTSSTPSQATPFVLSVDCGEPCSSLALSILGC